MHAPRPWTLKEQLLRSRFFLIAFLVHLIGFVMLSSFIIRQQLLIPEDPVETVFNPGATTTSQPPETGAPVDEPLVSTPVPSGVPGPLGGSPTDFPTSPNGPAAPMPFPAPSGPGVTSGGGFHGPDISGPTGKTPAGPSSTLNLAEVAATVKQWNVTFVNKLPVCRDFAVYVAHYNAPDWAANMELRGEGGQETVFRGSIPTLLRSIDAFSHGSVRGNVAPIPLRIDSNELFEKRPPFVFFTGHTDFVLTDAEVTNLRKYLLMGGAIWGDNAMAGINSRFDIAFRREMARVLPDFNLKIHPLPMTHPIFTSRPFPMTRLPSGMNYIQEPVEGIEIDGYLAVIYTPNNYGALMRMAFKPGNKNVPDLLNGPDKVAVTPWFLWANRDVYYRNFEPQACQEATQLGANIVFHLLGRFSDIGQRAP